MRNKRKSNSTGNMSFVTTAPRAVKLSRKVITENNMYIVYISDTESTYTGGGEVRDPHEPLYENRPEPLNRNRKHPGHSLEYPR